MREREREREREGGEEEGEIESGKCEAEWSGFLFGVAPNLLPSLFATLQPAKHAISAACTRFANIYCFHCFLREFIVFISCRFGRRAMADSIVSQA